MASLKNKHTATAVYDVVEDDDGDVSEEEEEDDDQGWDDWQAENDDVEGDGDAGSDSKLVCLFCDSLHGSCVSLFGHCASAHNFDFYGIKKALALDFYACFKLINYVRSQVAENKCWSCGITCQSKQDLLSHLHKMVSYEGSNFPWNDDKYLKPFMQEDAVLYNFGEEDEAEDEETMVVDEKELLRELSSLERISIDEEGDIGRVSGNGSSSANGGTEVAGIANNGMNTANPLDKASVNGVGNTEDRVQLYRKQRSKQLKDSFAKGSADEVKKINKNYFDSYSSFGIHREMISDKVRTDAYRQAILGNPSLLEGALVMDVGCGTGILSLFAAQAGASRVVAVEASDKMAAVAKQVAKDNRLLRIQNPHEGADCCTGVIEIAQGMVEELDNDYHIPSHSVDVLLSEWMGYCLLYESMLSSVLFARDRWLKPGGALLPDTATIFVAGFGRGATSIPFWENVYGFNMSCIAKEVVEDAAHVPIVDVIDSSDIVTNTGVLQSFDLMTMKIEEMDFTSEIDLTPLLKSLSDTTGLKRETAMCYGLVLWFDTGFTDRFCKESPTVLSTSPYTPKTHWAQTILTFREPIAIASEELGRDKFAAVGTDACPAVRIHSRISIVRASQHRSIDISVEVAGIGPDCRRRNWPAQFFSLS